MAGDELARRLLLERRRGVMTDVDRQRATGVEGAPGGRLGGARELAAEDDLRPAALAPRIRNGDTKR